MAHVPLDDETLDVAVFSLSLMGINFVDYLREAHRTLKLDGQLHIIEATERFTDRSGFTNGLKGLGFDVISVEDTWKFTHIRAQKTERLPREDVEIQFDIRGIMAEMNGINSAVRRKSVSLLYSTDR